ncbi:MAG TPA: VWA domain-containing protein [Candidatus Acidoferrum sp.]|nr:VWA domain-containing protein [Candidatus Acidoferrum sp.]
MYRVSYFGQCVLSMLALVVCARGARAQEVNCQRRTLPVALRDKLNLPIQGISAADFEAKVHGKPIKILSLAPDPRPHRLVLILDTSGSMGSTASDSPLITLEFALARHFFDVNRQRSQIALLMFNNDVTDVVDFARGNTAVGDKLQQIASDHNFVKTNVKGRTALRDAILEGLQLLDHPSSADALFVLTDGGDNASKRKSADVTQRLAVTSVRLFAVVLHQEVSYRNRTPEELSGPGELSEIAGKSGGEILSAAAWHGKQIALSADAEAKLKTQETLGRLYETILQDNLLEIELPFPIAKNEHWELKLSDAARRQWKGTQITYPTTLISCNSEVSGSGRR